MTGPKDAWGRSSHQNAAEDRRRTLADLFWTILSGLVIGILGAAVAGWLIWGTLLAIAGD